MRIQIRHTLFLLLLGLVACTGEVSELQKDSFMKFYGSYQYDEGVDILEISPGQYAILANTNPDTVNQATLLFADEYGNQIEDSPIYFGGGTQTIAKKVIKDGDNLLLFAEVFDAENDQYDVAVYKADVNGVLSDELVLEGIGDDFVYSACLRNGGGYVLCGSRSTGDQSDLWIAMLDVDLNLDFEFVGRDVSQNDEANSILQTEDGYLVLCTYDDGSLGGSDFYLLSFDENCNVLDTKVCGTENDDEAVFLCRYNTNDYVLMGNIVNEGKRAIMLHTFQTDGLLINSLAEFATISNGSPDLIGSACVITDDGTIVIVGNSEENANTNLLLSFVNANGEATFGGFGDIGNQAGNAIINCSDGKLIFTGMHSIEGNSLISLYKTDANGEL